MICFLKEKSHSDKINTNLFQIIEISSHHINSLGVHPLRKFLATGLDEYLMIYAEE